MSKSHLCTYRIVPIKNLSWKVQYKRQGGFFWWDEKKAYYEFDVLREFVSEKDAEDWIDGLIIEDKRREQVRLQDIEHLKIKPRIYPNNG